MDVHSVIPVLVPYVARVSMVVMKQHDQKQLGEGMVYLFYILRIIVP